MITDRLRHRKRIETTPGYRKTPIKQRNLGQEAEFIASGCIRTVFVGR